MRIRSPHLLLTTLTLIAALAACSTSPPAPVAGAPGYDGSFYEQAVR